MLKKNMARNIAIISVLLFLAFSLGFLSRNYKIFPFNIINYIYTYIGHSEYNKKLSLDRFSDRLKEYHIIESYLESNEFSSFQESYAKKIFDYINLDPIKFRSELIKKMILPKEIITISTKELKSDLEFQNLIPEDSLKELRNKIIINTEYYGLNHYGLWENEGNKNLLILHGGHGESKNPLDHENFLKLRNLYKI